MSKINNL